MRDVWADAAHRLHEQRDTLRHSVAITAACMGAELDGGARVEDVLRPESYHVEQLLRDGVLLADLLKRESRLWDAARAGRAMRRRTDPTFGHPAGAPAVDAQLITDTPRRSRVAELVDVAYGMTPAPADTADLPF